MLIIGCDYHPGFQQIAFVDTETGELQEKRVVVRFSRARKRYERLGVLVEESALQVTLIGKPAS